MEPMALFPEDWHPSCTLVRSNVLRNGKLRHPTVSKEILKVKKNQKGFSLIELLIVVAIILIIAAIAIPNLLRSRMAANEASAVGSMRTINTAAVTYSSTYGIGYPGTLAKLGPTASATSTSADLLDSVLAAGTKSGYVFTYTVGTADSAGN